MPMPKTPAAPSPRATLAAASLGVVLVILDVTVVNVALERIRGALDTDVTGLQWVVNAYALVFASLLLTAGALSDRFGAKRVFAVGLALFTLASLACGGAGTVAMLIAGRIAQGVGAALCLPTSLALVGASHPDPADRTRAVGIWAGAGGLALAAGPVVGGIMVERFGWPSIFLINLPFGLAGLALALARAPEGSRQPGRGLDLPGQGLAIVALGGLAFGFVQSGALGWTHLAILAGFALAAVAGAGFLKVEARSSTPMLPPALFRIPVVGTACLVGLLINFAYYGLMFVLSLFFQSAKGYSPLATGLAFLPMTALVTATNFASGALTARFGPRMPMALGQALAAAGYFALAGIDAATPYGVLVGPLLAAGVGVALAVPSMTAALLVQVPPQRAGIAAGALNAARQVGGAIGVGVFGSLVAGGTDALAGGMRIALVLAGAALLAGCALSLKGIRRGAGAAAVTVVAE